MIRRLLAIPAGIAAICLAYLTTIPHHRHEHPRARHGE